MLRKRVMTGARPKEPGRYGDHKSLDADAVCQNKARPVPPLVTEDRSMHCNSTNCEVKEPGASRETAVETDQLLPDEMKDAA
jgi:hypothetical protein